jgi:hypothetical protein
VVTGLENQGLVMNQGRSTRLPSERKVEAKVATFKDKKNTKGKNKRFAAKVWSSYWGDDERRALRDGKVHIVTIDKDNKAVSACPAFSAKHGYNYRNREYKEVTSAKRSEFCTKCLGHVSCRNFVASFKFEGETLVVKHGYPDPNDTKGSPVAIMVGSASYSGIVTWGKRVHAGILKKGGIYPACQQQYGNYRKGFFKIVEEAGWGDLCTHCAKHPEHYVPMLEKLGLTTTEAEIAKVEKKTKGIAGHIAADGSVRKYFIVDTGVPRGHISLPYTHAELMNFLRDNPKYVERIISGKDMHIMVGKKANLTATFKQVVETIQLEE